MASNGSFNTSAYNASDGTRFLTFSWAQSGNQNITANTTTISWELKGGGTSTQWIALRNVKLVIDGQTAFTYGGDYNTYKKLSNGTVVASGSLTFTHNSEGAKSFSVSLEGAIYTLAVNCSGSQTFTLNTIARASQPSLVTWPETTNNVGNFGETFSIHMNRMSSSFTHTVRYEYGSRTGTIATGVGTGTTWAVPLSFMNDIPENTSGSGRIYVDTYNGSTLIGTKYTGFTATVPASVIPTCSIALDDITGVDDIYGSPVKGLSEIKVTVSATQAYSSPIASYSISVNGATYQSSTATTGVLLNSGSVPVNVTVKDKRGRTGTASYTMSVQNYVSPALTSLNVKRCDANGTENPQGDYCQVAFSATVSSMSSKNTATYTCGYKKSGTSSWTEVQLTSLNNKYSASNSTYIFKADSNTSYDVRITVADRHGTATRTTSVSTAFTIMNWHTSGTGMGIGKVSEKENTLEVSLASDFSGEVYGKVYGLGELPQIPQNSDLNSYVMPGVYTITQNAYAETMQNIPTQKAGRLIVISAAGQKITETATWRYIEQRYIPYDYGAGAYDSFTYVRHINQSGTTNFTYNPWINEALKAYPVNSIYLAYDHVSPAQRFGGTWTRIENRFLWATTSGGSIGLQSGAAEVTLTVEQLPAHSHGSVYSQHAAGTKSQAWYTTAGTSLAYGAVSTGSGEAHNNMPPYIQVSVWRRTA